MRMRLDELLVARGLADNRSRAQALIMAGKVIVGEHRVDKAGKRYEDDVELRVKGDDGWASRGAYKLLGAFAAFEWLQPVVSGADCLDIGASTGGFCDVLLRHGAERVIALDVGYGQLLQRVARDPRVTVMDRTNIRTLPAGALPFVPAVATCDASFISVRKFLPVVLRELQPGGTFIVLVKPQFEVGPERVGKGGVVRDEATRQAALAEVQAAAIRMGFVVRGSAESPLAGPAGNREFLLALHTPTAATVSAPELS